MQNLVHDKVLKIPAMCESVLSLHADTLRKFSPFKVSSHTLPCSGLYVRECSKHSSSYKGQICLRFYSFTKMSLLIMLLSDLLEDLAQRIQYNYIYFTKTAHKTHTILRTPPRHLPSLQGVVRWVKTETRVKRAPLSPP